MTNGKGRNRGAALALCFLGAMLEGWDIQSMGLAAPRLGPEFGLNPAQIGYAATAALVGLAIGAWLGGRLADRVGRRAVLLGSFVALGVFSLGTAFAPGFGVLLAARLLTGLGMGGVFPNLIAIAAEAVPERSRSSAIAAVYSGMPFGGGVAGVMMFLGGAGIDWRAIFYVGGLGPLVLVPLLLFALPESERFREAAGKAAAARPSLAQVLFGEGRAAATLLLWLAMFFTLLVLYLQQNWLPTLMVAKGFTRPQGALISAALNFGAVAGSLLLGWLMDRGRDRAVVAVMYLGMAGAMGGLAALDGFGPLLAAGALAGFFVIGGQGVLYALAPRYYDVLIRGTGVGAAVAAGRMGSMSGPLLAGALLSMGVAPGAVLAATIPGLIVAAAAALVLLSRPPAR